MSIGLLFWVLMILWLILGIMSASSPWGWGGVGLLWVLLFLLGWESFGFPIRKTP